MRVTEAFGALALVALCGCGVAQPAVAADMPAYGSPPMESDTPDTPLQFGTGGQSLDPVDVLLTNRLTEISGEVTGANGLRVLRAAIVAFAEDRERWYPASRFVQYASSPDGVFTIRGLPAGEYFLAAVPQTKALDTHKKGGPLSPPFRFSSVGSQYLRTSGGA